MIENGIYPDLSHADYHAMTDRVSNSYLSRLALCPGAAKIEREKTPALVFGRAFHCFVLDGLEAFCRDVAIEPEVNRRTNDGKAELALFREQHKGKAIISADDLQTITVMDKSIKAHPMASQLIGTGTSEVSVFWDDPFSGLPCKARPDKIPDPSMKVLIDLKKTRDASPHGFQHSIVTYGYNRQAAMYLDGMNAITKEGYDVFAFVAVEDKEPYRVGVFTLSNTFIESGRREYQYLINLERYCREKGEWPNYTDSGAVELEVPRWMAYREDNY